MFFLSIDTKLFIEICFPIELKVNISCFFLPGREREQDSHYDNSKDLVIFCR